MLRSIELCILGMSFIFAGQGVIAAQSYPDINSELAAGKGIWMENCEVCHGYGIAGAPIPMRTRDWESRLDKPNVELYGNAISGFFGPGDTQMPARGGNNELTDDEVRRAVDYMVALARHYLDKL